jgi:hypothetical protein
LNRGLKVFPALYARRNFAEASAREATVTLVPQTLPVAEFRRM